MLSNLVLRSFKFVQVRSSSSSSSSSSSKESLYVSSRSKLFVHVSCGYLDKTLHQNSYEIVWWYHPLLHLLITTYFTTRKHFMIINKIQLPTNISLGLIPLLKPISPSSACSSKFQAAKQQHHTLLQFRYFMII